jgi:branched-chain amino acid transport system substrate-binding protein
LASTLDDLAAAFGADRPAAVCRELTKLYEEVKRGTLAELAAWAADGVRGEIAIVVGGAEAREVPFPDAVTQVLELSKDAADPAKATSAVTDFIGQGYKIIAGAASSGVAAQVAPLAAENQVLFISGPAATDGLTGINKYTFRSGRQSLQDVAAAGSFVPDIEGKKVVVFAQDNAFGQGNVASVTSVFGAGGATVTPLLVPATATDLVPFANQQIATYGAKARFETPGQLIPTSIRVLAK